MKPLDPQSRSLIDEVLAAELPPPELQTRVWQTLAPHVNATLPPPAAPAPHALGAKAGWFTASSSLLKVLNGVIAVGAVGASLSVGMHEYRSRHAPASPRPMAVLTPPRPEQPSAHAVPPLPLPLALDPAVAATTLLDETRLLASAQLALRSKQPGKALAWIEQHQTRFPRGALAQERDAARVFALCALQRTNAAKRAQQEFRRAWPASPLSDRVRSACAK